MQYKVFSWMVLIWLFSREFGGFQGVIHFCRYFLAPCLCHWKNFALILIQFPPFSFTCHNSYAHQACICVHRHKLNPLYQVLLVKPIQPQIFHASCQHLMKLLAGSFQAEEFISISDTRKEMWESFHQCHTDEEAHSMSATKLSSRKQTNKQTPTCSSSSKESRFNTALP